jgi:2-(1,2-epoxy-1,2-dihydrophenyl)acetyl-CoA isomerase
VNAPARLDPGLVRVATRDGIARITLARPARHNALVPDLIDGVLAALDAVAAADPVALVLAAEGASFSTGGDVAGFLAVPRGQRRGYADRLVGGLHEAILRLIDLPCPVVVRLQGPVTGGSVGFVLAADLAAMVDTAFLAPWYVVVGFSPDGGWTALLPERIGPARAGAIQMLNRRIGAVEAERLGLVTASVPAGELDPTLDGWLAALAGADRDSILATRRLLMPPDRRDRIAAGLAREKAMFLERIDSEAVEARMRRFLERAR